MVKQLEMGSPLATEALMVGRGDAAFLCRIHIELSTGGWLSPFQIVLAEKINLVSMTIDN